MFKWAIFLFPLISNASLYDYPQTPSFPLTEVRMGHAIEDNYKWMENSNHPLLWDWVKRQQEFTNSVLDQQKVQEFYDDIKILKEISKKPMTQVEENFLAFNFPDEGGEGLEKKDEYTIKQESIFGGDLSRVTISKDGKIQDILIVKFFEKITLVGDILYYITDRDTVLGGSTAAIFSHKIGEKQSQDKLILETDRYDSHFESVKLDKEYVYLIESNIYDETSTFFKLNLETSQVSLKRNFEGQVLTSLDDSHLIIKNYKDSNFGSLYKYNINTAKQDVLMDEEFNVDSVLKLDSENFFVSGHKNAAGVCGTLSIVTGDFTAIDLPKEGICYFKSFSTSKGLEIRFMAPDTPTQVFSYDLEQRSLQLVSYQEYPIKVEAQRVSYIASNGQEANIWLYKKKGQKLSADTPLILYGYGGFQVTMMPYFNPSDSLSWLKRGGAYAIVSLPGSLTYGMDWHQIARKAGRYHSFDSFAAAANELIDRGFTSKEKIGMTGGSNGGLLVAGTMQRHPQLFRAAVPMVGVLDLLNFDLFGAGKYWTAEYGSAQKEEDFEHLLKFSPYHTLTAKEYPAVMVMTAEFDDRVVPMHSFKYAAKLQEVQQGSNPALIYTKEWAGHSSRTGSEDGKIRYMASMYAFFATYLGL